MKNQNFIRAAKCFQRRRNPSKNPLKVRKEADVRAGFWKNLNICLYSERSKKSKEVRMRMKP